MLSRPQARYKLLLEALLAVVVSEKLLVAYFPHDKCLYHTMTTNQSSTSKACSALGRSHNCVKASCVFTLFTWATLSRKMGSTDAIIMYWQFLGI